MTYDQWKTRSPDDEEFRGKPYGSTHCEKCDGTKDVNENEYGEFICESCEQNAAEGAYERLCEGEPPVTESERHQAAWNEHQKAHRR
jgi:ribosomal protein L37AE/L43A